MPMAHCQNNRTAPQIDLQSARLTQAALAADRRCASLCASASEPHNCPRSTHHACIHAAAHSPAFGLEFNLRRCSQARDPARFLASAARDGFGTSGIEPCTHPAGHAALGGRCVPAASAQRMHQACISPAAWSRAMPGCQALLQRGIEFQVFSTGPARRMSCSSHACSRLPTRCVFTSQEQVTCCNWRDGSIADRRRRY